MFSSIVCQVVLHVELLYCIELYCVLNCSIVSGYIVGPVAVLHVEFLYCVVELL